MITLQFHLEGKGKTVIEEHSIKNLFGLSDKEWEDLPIEEADKKLDDFVNIRRLQLGLKELHDGLEEAPFDY